MSNVLMQKGKKRQFKIFDIGTFTSMVEAEAFLNTNEIDEEHLKVHALKESVFMVVPYYVITD
jgi:hypothetical protein